MPSAGESPAGRVGVVVTVEQQQPGQLQQRAKQEQRWEAIDFSKSIDSLEKGGTFGVGSLD